MSVDKFLFDANGVEKSRTSIQTENEIWTLNNPKLAAVAATSINRTAVKRYRIQQSTHKQLLENNAKLTADLELANEKFNKVNASGERRDIVI